MCILFAQILDKGLVNLAAVCCGFGVLALSLHKKKTKLICKIFSSTQNKLSLKIMSSERAGAGDDCLIVTC